VAEPRKEWELRLRFGAASRSGAVVATLAGAVVHRGSFRLGPVDLQLDWADRVAVRGANGSGKTTLIEAILGRAPLSAGRRSLGPSVVVGEIDQARRTFDPASPLLDAFCAHTGQLPGEARTLLAKFGLGAGDVLRPAGSLSPGERTRADLAMLAQAGANLLVLDEPTNHLDLPAIEQLEQALGQYDGTLLLVTHDRRLLEHVPVTRHLMVADGQLTEE
jgi:ATPase subunit of ABC transporter with duplicated ATPase domains